MSNSPLVIYTKLSPNHSGQRTHGIDRITPHCVVGQCSLQTLGNIFAPTSRQASCNYGVDPQGQVGMYVEEKHRSWCSSSNANDQRAVTIEVASDTTAPYAITDKAYEGLVKLMTDICQRNGKTKILWFADKEKTLAYEPKANEMVITVHRWFANKSCPGDYIYNRLGKIAEEINARLGGGITQTSGTAIMGSAVLGADRLAAFLLSKNSAPKLNGVDAAKLAQLYISEGKTEGVRGDLAFCQSCLETGYWQFKGDVKPEQNNFSGIGAAGGGAQGASFPDAQTGIRAQIQHLKAYASKDALKNSCVDPRYNLVSKGCAPTLEGLSGRWAADTGYGAKILSIYNEAAAFKAQTAEGKTEEKNTVFPKTPFSVKVIVSDLNYRTEPSMSGEVKGQTGKNTFTITEVKDGWGKLKSGAGWIYLENPSYVTIGKTIAESTQQPTQAKKTVEELAKEVIRGDWGNGTDRKNRLTAAGYDYSAVQKRVDELMSAGNKQAAKKSVDEIAKEVLHGDWGNGEERKKRLTAAGYDYAAVQSRVNQLCR